VSRIGRTALVGFLLLVLFPLLAVGQVLLLHGWRGDGTNWNECVHVMTAAPYNIDPDQIFSPSLPNSVSLVEWTANVAKYIDSLPEDVRLTVIAHSFGGTSILFLFIVAHHVEKGDLAQWAIDLGDQDAELGSIITALVSFPDPDLFVRAARRVNRVFLYHPALGGGCLACSACGDVQVPLICDDAVRDMCVLTTTKDMLFSADEIEALEVPVVDIYGTHTWCPGVCLPISESDGSVSLSGQRLFLTKENYHEIDGGAICHIDFIINMRHAAEDLIKIAFSTKERQAASQ